MATILKAIYEIHLQLQFFAPAIVIVIVIVSIVVVVMQLLAML